MTVEEIFELWDVDSEIDRTELGNEALKTSKLHNKYFKIFTNERLVLRKLNEKKKQLKLLKFEYFTGVLDEETLKERGWSPNPKRIIRGDTEMYIEADQEMVDLNLRIAYQQEKIELLDSIIKTIGSRNFNITNAVKWEQFKVGA